MNDILTVVVSLLMGGGVWAGVSAFIKSFAENKKTKAEAADVGAKTPLETESISVATMALSLKNAAETIARLEGEGKTIRERLDSIEEQMRRNEEQARFLRRALGAAHDYIRTLLSFIERTVPDAVPPQPEESFDFPPHHN